MSIWVSFKFNLKWLVVVLVIGVVIGFLLR